MVAEHLGVRDEERGRGAGGEERGLGPGPSWEPDVSRARSLPTSRSALTAMANH